MSTIIGFLALVAIYGLFKPFNGWQRRHFAFALLGLVFVSALVNEESVSVAPEPKVETASDAKVDEPVVSRSSSGMETVTRTMSYRDCINQISVVATQFGVAPINIVETSAMRTVRFPTSDGSVLVTCSRPDRKMVLIRSPFGAE